MAEARRSDHRRTVMMVAEAIAEELKRHVSAWAARFNVSVTTKAAFLDSSPHGDGITLRLMVDRTEYVNHNGGTNQFPVTTRIMNFTTNLGELDLALEKRQALVLQDATVRVTNFLNQYAHTRQLMQKEPAFLTEIGKAEERKAQSFTLAGFHFEPSSKPNHVWMHRADGPHAGEGAEVHADMLRKALADFFTKKF